MAEPERRRRRLRGSSSGAVPVPPRDAPVTRPVPPPRPDPANTRPDPAPPYPAGTRPDPPSTRPDPGPGADRPAPARPAAATGYGEEPERGLRGLVGSGSSQVSVAAAMRARDAARPTEEQLAEAERNLTVVRRNWTPREDLPRRS